MTLLRVQNKKKRRRKANYNSSCSLSNTVKKVFVGIGEVFKNITMKWGEGASTPTRMPAKKASAADATAPYNTLPLGLVSGESADSLRPKNILSPLLNDGNPVPGNGNRDSDKDKKMILNTLLKIQRAICLAATISVARAITFISTSLFRWFDRGTICY